MKPLLVSGAAVHQDTDPDALSEALSVSDGITGWDWATAGIVLIAAFIVSRLARVLIRRVLRRHADPSVGDLISRLISYVLVVFGFVYALDHVGVAIGPLLGALGIIGIALAFALRDLLENFVAGLLLQFRRPFSYGDEIVSGDTEGTVASIDARSVTVATPDGETVYIPSSQVITDAIINRTERGSLRTTLSLGVAYGTDLAEAQQVFCEAMRSVEGVREEPEPEALLEGFGDSSIDFALRFWHDPTIAAHWQVRSGVAFSLDAAAEANGIEIPYPQRVVRVPASDDV